MRGRITLRRACRPCTKAKRQCDLQSPQCGRCVGRALFCSYENQPSSNTSSKDSSTTKSNPKISAASLRKTGVSDVHTDRIIVRTVPDGRRFLFDKATRIWFPSGLTISEARFLLAASSSLSTLRLPDAAINLPMSTATFLYTTNELSALPSEFVRTGRNHMMHPSIYDALPEYHHPRVKAVFYDIASLHAKAPGCEADKLRALDRHVTELVGRANTAFPNTSSLLISTQSLIMALICFLFPPTCTSSPFNHTSKSSAGALSPLPGPSIFTHLRNLKSLGYQLWTSAPWEAPAYLASNAVVGFHFGESARRTIITAKFVIASWSVLRQGWFEHTAFIEALPLAFGEEFGGGSPWVSPRGEELQGRPSGGGLISYRELVDLFDEGKLDGYMVERFIWLLLAACKGVETVDGRVQHI